MCPPVIEDLGNVAHLLRIFHAAENKIIILGALEFTAESSCFLKHGTPYHKKVTDIVIGSQKIQIKIRFQMRLEVFAEVCGNLIFIRIDRVKAAVFRQRGGNFIKRVRRQQIVMIQKPDKLSFRHLQRRVGIPGYSQILTQVFHPDPFIFSCIFPQKFFHFRIFGASIGDTQLPVPVCLRQKRVHHLRQESPWRTVRGNRHTDQRFPGQFLASLSVKLRFIRHIGLVPRSIGDLFRFKALMKADPELFWPVMLQVAEPFPDRIGIQFFHHTAPLYPSSRILFFVHILILRVIPFYIFLTFNRVYFIIPPPVFQGCKHNSRRNHAEKA